MPILPFKLNQDRRHHIPRQQHKVTNWPAYDASLRQRGSLTVWFTDEAIAAWAAEPRTTRGGQAQYSPPAILTALTIRAVFRLAYRQAEGLLGSIIGLLGLSLRVPDHTTLSRRAATLDVPPPGNAGAGAGSEPMHLLVDSTGLKLCGKGEWLLEKHGTATRRSWRALHLGVDAGTGRIVACTLTAKDVDDAESIQNRGVLIGSGKVPGSRDEGGLVPKLVWRVKLVAELRPGVMVETEVARIERDEQAGLAELGLQLAEAKQLTAALQAQIVPAQVAVVGERRRSCVACGRVLASKGHYGARFRSLFGDVPVRIRRLLVCPCQDPGEANSFAALDLGKDAVAPELAYVTARYAALVPFGKVASLLSELLPMGGAQNTGTVRNRTLRVGTEIVQKHPVATA